MQADGGSFWLEETWSVTCITCISSSHMTSSKECVLLVPLPGSEHAKLTPLNLRDESILSGISFLCHVHMRTDQLQSSKKQSLHAVEPRSSGYTKLLIPEGAGFVMQLAASSQGNICIKKVR